MLSVPAAFAISAATSADNFALVPVTIAVASVTFPSLSLETLTVASIFSPDGVVAVTFLSSVVTSDLSSFLSDAGVSVEGVDGVTVEEPELPESDTSPTLYKKTSSTDPHAPAAALIVTITSTSSPAYTSTSSVHGFCHLVQPLNFAFFAFSVPRDLFTSLTLISS